MFLTGFDATTLNTLWVDKNLKLHGLIQAFSRTNRILNSVKTFGNIVCFRNLQKRVDTAISLFGDRDAGGIVLLRSFDDYYRGYEDRDGRHVPGYEETVGRLKSDFPVAEQRLTGEKRKKDFVGLFGAFLRMRNLLTSFDEFRGRELLSERDLQDYLGRYQDLRDEMRGADSGPREDISDDVVFEMELVRQIEVNIDYILALVKRYHDGNCQDKEVLLSIRKAMDASPELRSKKELVENFIARVNGMGDVLEGWNSYVEKEREAELSRIIKEERLREAETRKFMENAFRDGEVRTSGTGIDRILPPMSRFGGGRDKKKQGVIARLKEFFLRFFGIGGRAFRAEKADMDADEGSSAPER